MTVTHLTPNQHLEGFKNFLFALGTGFSAMSSSSDSVLVPTEQERARDGDNMKDKGNDLFRQGLYREAAKMYNTAVEINGTQPAYMSNLAATYLKLQNYELAESAATMALRHAPQMHKARFRRGLARKATMQLRAAATDFATILKEDSDCADAKSELASVHALIENGEEDESLIWEEWDHPTPDSRPEPPISGQQLRERAAESESDLEDHVGNGIPCKHHNLKPLGCAKGASCAYSHAPDARSIPDSEGRNVCLYFLLGSCKFGERCLYSHSKANLPDLWGDESRIPDVRELIRQNEEAIRDRRLFTKYMGKGPFAPAPLVAMKRAIDEARMEAALSDLLGVSDDSFIIHLTLNKSTEIPNDLLSGLREVIDVTRVKSKSKAFKLLSSEDVAGIFITDAGITEPHNANLLAKIVAYVRGGGTVVIGGSFQLLEGNKKVDIAPAKLETFFHKGWGLPWKMGSQHPRETFTLNRNTAIKSLIPLPGSINLKGVHLKVRADKALYLRPGHSHLDSANFRASDLVETPAVVTEFGEGRLCFLTGSGAQEANIEVLLAMFGIRSLQ
ncbi:RNA polymerase II-associated protein 3 [Mycena sanguinolenta]|uniref:RNA polymerase II-associated protein 3 n=1 Tax=Mycena sanguinolenta TaxID=230812 RepID=A0A8H7D534_9AGAR|nr:RNA polymerase II-associated protein 3 [Mycena sanguinolenta]